MTIEDESRLCLADFFPFLGNAIPREASHVFRKTVLHATGFIFPLSLPWTCFDFYLVWSTAAMVETSSLPSGVPSALRFIP